MNHQFTDDVSGGKEISSCSTIEEKSNSDFEKMLEDENEEWEEEERLKLEETERRKKEVLNDFTDEVILILLNQEEHENEEMQPLVANCHKESPSHTSLKDLSTEDDQVKI